MNFRGGGYNVDKAEERGGKTRGKEGREEEEREAREAGKIGEKSGKVAEGGGEREWIEYYYYCKEKES